jgi:hypothetical protein
VKIWAKIDEYWSKVGSKLVKIGQNFEQRNTLGESLVPATAHRLLGEGDVGLRRGGDGGDDGDEKLELHFDIFLDRGLLFREMPDCDETRSRWRPFIGMDPGFGQSVSSTFGI